MKGLSRDDSGWRLQANVPGHQRVRLRLGDLPDDDAKAVATHVHRILAARLSGAPLSLDTAEWLGNLPAGLQEKLCHQGVIDDSLMRPTETKLGEFLELYFKRPEDRADATIAQLKLARNNLLTYFGPSRLLRSITHGEAIDYKKWLAQPRGKSQTRWKVATVNRICGRSKELLRYAVDRDLIDKSPFEGVGGLTVRANRDRQFIVDPHLTARIIAAMPDTTWRLIFALARYGGLRSPSEQRTLRWEHIRWDDGKIHIYCVKTKRHAGREWREVPLWPELRPYLEAARAEAPADAEWVINHYRSKNANPAVHFARLLKRAGIPLYPKLMQNLRYTRSMELIDAGYPEHVVQAWIGHSATISKEHYRGVTEDHFRRALGERTSSADPQADGRRVKSGSARGPNSGQGSPNPKTPSRSDRNNSRENRRNNRNGAGALAPINARERT